MIYDIIIVGLGSHGSACFQHFSKNKKVLGIEQFQSPHVYGSHHGDSRLVRDYWYQEKEYLEMGQRCLQLWEKLQAESSEQIYKETGGICFGKLSDYYYQVSFPNNIKPKNITEEEVQQKFGIRTKHLEYIQYESKGGFVVPEKVIKHFIQKGLSNGGHIINNCKYVKHESNNDTVKVYTDLGIFTTKKLLMTLGQGLKQFEHLYPLLSLQIQKQQVVFIECKNEKYQNLPIFLCEQNGYLIYGFTPNNGLLKCGIHWFGAELSYDNPQGGTDNHNYQMTLNIIRNFFQQYMPDLVDAPVIKYQNCYYTNTPDKHFIIDFEPGNKNVVLLSACSGHGFKFCIGMGELIEDMLNKGKAPYKLFELSRFNMPKL